MKCDSCASLATIHEVSIRDGQRVERHLCEACGRQAGIVVKAQASVSDLLAELGSAMQASAGAGAASAEAAGNEGGKESPNVGSMCACCGMSFAQFRKDGLLGCSECYKAFEAQLTPLLERFHEGGTHHVGKMPRRASSAPSGLRASAERSEDAKRWAGEMLDSQDRERRLQALRRQLEESVASEDYRKAAGIRDELLRLGDPELVRRPAGGAEKESDEGGGGAAGGQRPGGAA